MGTYWTIFPVVSLVFLFTIEAHGFFNPLELYVGASEGFSLAHIDAQNGGKKIYDIFIDNMDRPEDLPPCSVKFGHHDEDIETLQLKTDYSKLKISRRGFLANTYHVHLWYYDYYDIKHDHSPASKTKDWGRYLRSVPLGDDGSIALQCSNGKYLKWDSFISKHSPCHLQPKDPCTSLGICEQCKFYPEIGSINPFFIEIVSVDWGDVSQDIVKNPSVLSRDQQDNWSDEIVSNTYSISYTDKSVETTTWENTWGFEFSVTSTTKITILDVFEQTIEISAKTSYNGMVGGSTSTEETTQYDKSSTYPCPAKHRCFFNLIGRHMNNQQVPFTATVRKTDGSKTKEWKEKGVWEGVKVYDTYTEFCTEDLVTGENNCPHKLRLPITR